MLTRVFILETSEYNSPRSPQKALNEDHLRVSTHAIEWHPVSTPTTRQWGGVVPYIEWRTINTNENPHTQIKVPSITRRWVYWVSFGGVDATYNCCLVHCFIKGWMEN